MHHNAIQFYWIKLIGKYICLIAENFEQSNLIDLKSELKILIHVGGNENIVNILGACTKGSCHCNFSVHDKKE